MTLDNETYKHSFEVQEIIGKTPNWAIRWGVTALFLTIFGLLLIGWFIKYPIEKKMNISLALENAPVYIQKNSQDSISFNSNSTHVAYNDLIATYFGQHAQHQLKAPFSGNITTINSIKINSASPATGIDTFAILVPDLAVYKFSGQIPVEYVQKKGFEHSTVQIAVLQMNEMNEEIPLTGHITEVSPVANNQMCSFWGELDMASNNLLVKKLLYSPNCAGIIHYRVSNESILKKMIGK